MEQFTDEGCGGFDGGIVVVLMEIVVVEWRMEVVRGGGEVCYGGLGGGCSLLKVVRVVMELVRVVKEVVKVC
jgi:hypothetical protein